MATKFAQTCPRCHAAIAHETPEEAGYYCGAIYRLLVRRMGVEPGGDCTPA